MSVSRVTTMSVKPRRTGVRSIAAPFERRRLSIVINEEQRDLLDQLLATGLFGLTRTDVVRRLLDEKLRELVEQGWDDR